METKSDEKRHFFRHLATSCHVLKVLMTKTESWETRKKIVIFSSSFSPLLNKMFYSWPRDSCCHLATSECIFTRSSLSLVDLWIMRIVKREGSLQFDSEHTVVVSFHRSASSWSSWPQKHSVIFCRCFTTWLFFSRFSKSHKFWTILLHYFILKNWNEPLDFPFFFWANVI